MKNIGLLAAASAVVLAGGASAKAVHPTVSVKHQPKHSIIFPQNGASVIYDQSQADNGVGIVSQNFESSFDAYDSDGADDFTVPSGQKWIIKKVVASGVYFNGSGPASTANVTVYADDGGSPGIIIDDKDAGIIIDDKDAGIITVDLGEAVKLKGGRHGTTYWISVQANMDFSTGGEWGWNTNNTISGNPSVWQNPGNGFSTGCTTYTTTTACIPSGEGGDFAFALLGKAKIAGAREH